VSVGVFSLVVSAAILATMYYLKLSVFEMLSKHFAQLAVVTMLAAVLFGIIAHVAARRLPPKLVSHRANTGQFYLIICSCCVYVMCNCCFLSLDISVC